MKMFLKRLLFLIFLLLVVGFGLSVYILQAPPVEQEGVPKLQVHTRTAVRGRPSVDSKPLVYTKDVYLFNLDQRYISNLNSKKPDPELLFSAALGHRASLKSEQLDTALRTATDWQKMFADMTTGMRFRPATDPLEVLLSGEEWRLRDASGAAYKVVKAGNTVDVYLPDLREAFEAKNVALSQEITLSTKRANQEWRITDKSYQQTYTILKSEGKLNVFQQSKFQILTYLFDTDTAYQDALAQGKLHADLIQEFVEHKVPISRGAKVSANEDGIGWQIASPPLTFALRPANADQLRVTLDLKSKWLRIEVPIKGSDSINGWLQSSRGTIFEPPPPMLSSRQQLKTWLLAQIDDLKTKVGLSTEEAETETEATPSG